MREYTKEWLQELCANSFSYAEVLRKAGRSPTGGGSVATLKKKIEDFGIDVSHFTGQGWNKNNFDFSRFQKDRKIKNGTAAKPLIYIRGHRCECCGLEEWLNGLIPLEVHHIDGDRLNNEEANLQLLCPNCHALTDNYRGKNIKKKENKDPILEDKFVEALKSHENIHQALLALGLAPKGSNYSRAKKLIKKHQILHLQ